MKTPLEQLIDKLDFQISDCNDKQGREKGTLLYIRNKAKSLLQEERKVIEDAFVDGVLNWDSEKTEEQYFETKFAKDGK